MRLKALLLPIALAAVTIPAEAQQPAAQVSIAPGSRVRVTSQAMVAPLVANFLEQRGDTLVFIEDGTGRGVWRLPLSQVERLEITTGEGGGSRRHIGRGALIGGAAGLVAGLVFASTASPSDSTREYSRVMTSAVGAAIGGGIGAFIGSRMKTERWANVPLPRQVSLAPDGRGGLRIAVSFR